MIKRRGRQALLFISIMRTVSFGGCSKPLKAVVTRESSRDSLGLLSPLRCDAATLIRRIFA